MPQSLRGILLCYKVEYGHCSFYTFRREGGALSINIFCIATLLARTASSSIFLFRFCLPKVRYSPVVSNSILFWSSYFAFSSRWQTSSRPSSSVIMPLGKIMFSRSRSFSISFICNLGYVDYRFFIYKYNIVTKGEKFI